MPIHYVPPVSFTTKRLVLDNEKLRRANGKVTAGAAYNYGDLLTLSDDNVLTHAADESSWDVICGQNVTAAEATIKAADGIEIPVYYGGVFNVEAVSLNGALLDKAKYDAARAKATKNKIELSKV